MVCTHCKVCLAYVQCVFGSVFVLANTLVTPKITYFHYLKKPFQDRSIPEKQIAFEIKITGVCGCNDQRLS